MDYNKKIFYVDKTLIDKKNKHQIVEVVLNPDANIFKEHFPGAPIFPGSMSITLANKLNKNYFIYNSADCFYLNEVNKFLFSKPITPDRNPKLFFHSYFQFLKHQCLVKVKILNTFDNIMGRGLFKYFSIGD